MAVTINAKGTSVPYFKIGKGGTTVYQGTADPSVEFSPIENDVWIDSANNSVRYRTNSNTWTAAGATIATGANPPSNPTYGDLWFDDGSTGKIYIWLGNGWVDTSPTPTISDINDVSLTSLSDGQVLTYDSANSVWINTTTSSSLNDTDGLPEGSTNLYFTNARADARIAAASIDDLNDVDTSTIAPMANQTIVWDASSSLWKPGNRIETAEFSIELAQHNLYELADIDVAGLQNNSVLKWDNNAASWVVGTNSVAGATASAIIPVALAHITLSNYTANSGTGISWGTYQYSSGNYGYYEFTFTTAQPNANYAVITDMVVAGDTNISPEVSNRTTTGFRVNFYDNNGTELNVGSVATYEPVIMVYASNPIQSVTSDTYTSSDDLAEGSTNLYFTDARAIAAVEGEATLDLTGALTVTGNSTLNDKVTIVDDGSNPLDLNRLTDTGDFIAFQVDSVQQGTIGVDSANHFVFEADLGYFKLRSQGATQLQVEPSRVRFNTPAYFAVDVGTEFMQVEGGVDDTFETRFFITEPTADALITFPNATGTVALTSYVDQATNNSANWDTAYGWGNHSLAGYLTSYTETDPIFSASAAANITAGQILSWDTAYGWGDHSIQGYLTSETETYSTATELLTAIKTVDGIGSLLDADQLDGQEGSYYLNYNNFTNTPTIPSSSDDLTEGSSNLFYSSVLATSDARAAISVSGDLSYDSANGIISYSTPTNVSAFTNDAGYLTTVALNDLSDVVITTPSANQVISYNGINWVNSSTNANNWDDAYSWGDHSLAGYLTSETYSTATELLTAIKTVDGTTSGLDADLWDGNQFADYIDQSVTTASNVTFNDVTVSGTLYSDDVTATNVTITGNLAVSGTVVTVNTETVTFDDNILLLNSNATGTATQNAGLEIERGDDVNVLFVWDETNDRWTFGAEDVYTTGDLTVNDVSANTVVTSFSGNLAVNLNNINTDNLAEGSANLYYTDERVDARIALNDTNDYVDSISFDTSDGGLTLGRTGNLSDLTVNLDGRYQIAGTYDNYVSWNISDGTYTEAITSAETLTIAGGGGATASYNSSTNTLTISSSDTIDYINSAAFDIATGILSLTGVGNAGASVDLDGRYSLTDTTYTAGDGLTLTGTVFSANVNGGLEIDINDDIIISDTSVANGSYGSADSTTTFTVNSRGQLTAAGTTPISITASQVSDFNDGVKAAMAMTHSGVYYVSASDETSNSSANLGISANTLGFNLAGKEIYMVYLNRLLLRPSEYTLDTGTGTITFQQNLLSQNDEIEAVYYG